MEMELERYDENDNLYILVVEVDYNCSPLEYEAGYYFAGGVEVEGAKIIDIINEPDDEGNIANVTFKVGDNVELKQCEVDSVAERVIRDADDDGGYPRMHISPDW